ncbi:NhaA family Na+:H+ antiporter [Sphingomonas jinjuensis]|uniref:Na(+)/H(+) antiporter NhaA n=1 Tax=Sphingomonas jinjuensis TaxID=535907 RepID=A0A840FEP4_9SPHN|nr:Na+/H+ antiporter NhaA [Sphingomonas jinjuensis]MBB4152478.1 NhaA family Na+:H+ antiporter [Sphingomonas jinjuensis]
MRHSSIRHFLTSEAAGGVALVLAAALALILANSGAAHGYHALVDAVVGPTLAPALGPMTVHLWINDGAMALFFLLVGLEIKRELVGGELASAERRRLPFVAAAAGMIVPALVYLAATGGAAELRSGWAIPAATDIAFAIGVLALLGDRVPMALKLLLTTIAIVDDMGAVAIIALGYTASIDATALIAAVGVVLVMLLLNRRGVRALSPYLLLAVLLWWLVLRSGVHATIAGVVAAMLVPAGSSEATSPLDRLEHALQPWIAFLVLPLFAFVNAGVSLGGVGAALGDRLAIGIALGLFLGKQGGILAAIWAADRTGFARRPDGIGWVQLHGMALVAGIGFTMSLFIGDLAFPGDAGMVERVKIGVIAGSLLSALTGIAVFSLARRRRT